jgi:hypothetical protein
MNGTAPGFAENSPLTQWVEAAATGIELLAMVIIIAVILAATAVYLYRILAHGPTVLLTVATATRSRVLSCSG